MAKRCPECGEVKCSTEFYKNKPAYDGLSAYCKLCVKMKMAKRYEENKDVINRRRALVRATEKYRKEASERSSKWAKNNPSAHWSHTRSRKQMMVIRSFKSEKLALNSFYLRCPAGHHVDHIVPLKHPLVCGLHVMANLQYLTAFENDSKGNKFEVQK